MSITHKSILITGAAQRVGRHLALSLAQSGANIIVHYGQSHDEAMNSVREIEALGSTAWAFQANLANPQEVFQLVHRAFQVTSLYAIINNASIFEPLTFQNTGLNEWQNHFAINLTAPFLLSQQFSKLLPAGANGRILNLLDWRALRPGKDHFPYTISKSALASLTRSLAIELAPRITVNGIALGAVLPPKGQAENPLLLQSVPAQRWASLDEVAETATFLLDGPDYITGEIIHLDGGRHLI